MKRNNWLLALVAILILITGCQPSPETMDLGPGTLKVIIGNNTRSLESNVSLETASYELIAEPEAGALESIVLPITLEETVKTLTLNAGNWKVTVYAINDKGVRIGSGTSSVLVESGQEKSCNVAIEENKGMGVFNFRLRGVYPDFVITADILRYMDDPNPISLDLHKANEVYYATEKLEKGSYILSVKLNGNPYKTDVFRIVANGQTNADVTVSSENKVVIQNGSDVPENTIASNGIIGGLVENGTSYPFHSDQPAIWFVDGMIVAEQPVNDFTWTPSGLQIDSVHEISALTGVDSFGILRTIKLKVGGLPSIIPVVKYDHVLAGDEVLVDFTNVPEGLRVKFIVSVGDDVYNTWVSSTSHTREISIPADMPVGETDVEFMVIDETPVKIGNLHLTIGSYVTETPIAMELNSSCYIGDGLRLSFANGLPVGMEASLTVDGIEFSSILYKGARNGKLWFRDIKPGTHECTVTLYNGGIEIPTTGNTATVEFRSYTLPKISISAVSPVYSGEAMEIHLSEALPVGIGAEVFIDGKDLCYVSFEPNETVSSIWIPNGIAAGTHKITFKCFFDGQPVEIPGIDFTVKDFEVPAMEFVAPKYVNRYNSLVLENPAIRDLDVQFLLSIDGQPMRYKNYKWKGDDLEVHIGDISNGEHTITGTALMRGKEVAITPVTFNVSGVSFNFTHQKSYVDGAVNYEFSRSIGDVSGLEEFAGAETTLHITDLVESSGPIVLDDAAYSWTYSGKKPFLELTADLRAKDGTLLFRKRNTSENFVASIEGPKYVTLPAGGSVEAEYTFSFNRNDIDWGFDAPFAWELDRGDLEDYARYTWNQSDKGMHELNLYVYRGSYWYNICSSEILVSVENIDTAIDFDITPVRRPRYSYESLEFDIECSEPISEENVHLQITMDGVDVTEYHYCYRQDDSHLLEYGIDIPSFMMGKKLVVEARLLGSDGSVIQKSSTSYDIEDLYMVSWTDYRMPITDSLSIEIIGSRPNEAFTFYDGDVKLEIPGKHGTLYGNSLFVNISEFGFGLHSLVAVSTSDPTRRSEVYSWYAVPGIEFASDNLKGSPADKMNIKLNLVKNPDDHLPETVEYSLSYQYPGHDKVVLPSNSTGNFVIPVNIKDGLIAEVEFTALCGGKSYGKTRNVYTQNCEFVGLPETIAKGSNGEYTLTFKWYDDLMTYEDYNYTWSVNGTNVGTGRTVTTILPSDKDKVSVVCNVSHKTASRIGSWINIKVPVV